MSTQTQIQIADIRRQVEALSFAAFGQQEALALGQTLLAIAQEETLPVAVGLDLGGQIMFRAALPGTNADFQSWIDRKFNAVRRFSRSSLELELQLQRDPDFARARALDPATYVLCGGAVPILIGSTMVGCIGCAGLASADDHGLAIRALTRFQEHGEAGCL